MKVKADLLHTEGNIDSSSGRLTQALSCYGKSLKIHEDVNNTRDIPIIEMNIGVIHSLQGSQDQALEYFFKALEASVMLSNIYYKSIIISNIGHEFWKKADITSAIHYTKQALEIFQSSGNSTIVAEILSNLIVYHLEIKEKQSAENYYNELSDLERSTNDSFIRNLQMISKALILKSRKRIKELSMAQDILYELVSDKNIDTHLFHVVALNLCEILLIEFRESNYKLVLNEITDLISKLLYSAKTSNSQFLEVQVMTLIANLTVIKGDFQSAKSRFDEVIKLAEDREYYLLRDKARQQERKLFGKFHNWQNLFSNETSINNLMQQVQVEEYLDFIMKSTKN